MGILAVSEEGDASAPAVLCLHGIPGSRRDFRYLGPALAGRLRVVRIDMPGFGGSPDDGRPRLTAWSEAVIGVADALGLGRFLLLAHSFGGGAALLAAAHAADRVGGVALLASMGLRRHRAFLLPPPAYRLLGACLGVPGVRRPIAAATRSIYKRIGLPVPPAGDVETPRRHVRLLGSADFGALGAAARAVNAPVIVLHAADDQLVEVAIARELAGCLPNSELIVFPSGGHHLNRTRAREIAGVLSARWGSAGTTVGVAIG